MYYEGKGIRQDYEKARIYLEIAALQDNEYAQANLGLMYMKGQRVEKNINLAIKWLTKAANKGNQIAQRNLYLIKTQNQ